MNEELLEQIRQIIGEGSSVNKVERLTEYVLSLGQGSGSGGESIILFEPKTFDLRPTPYPDEIYVDFARKDCFSLREKKDFAVVHYRDFVPDHIREPIFSSPAAYQDKELELTINVNIRYQIALHSEGFEDLNLWQGLVMDIGFDMDSEPEIIEPLARVPVSVVRDHGGVQVMSANYTKVVRLPLGHGELSEESLTYTFNNLRLACQLDWDRAGFPFEEYSQKVMWKDKAIELTPLNINITHAEPFGVSVLDMRVVDKITDEVVPV